MTTPQDQELTPQLQTGRQENVLPIFTRTPTRCLSVYVSVCVPVCLCACRSVCLYPVCLSVCMYVCLYLRLYACLSVCLSVSLSVCVSVCLSVCLFLCLSVCMPVCLHVSVCLFACLSVSVCLSVCLSICLSVCPLSNHHPASVFLGHFFKPEMCRLATLISPIPCCADIVLQQGRKQGPGGAAVSWRIGTEGSKRKIGRGTAIDKVAKHNSFQGVMPANPTHQDITSDRLVHGILKGTLFCISCQSLVSILIHCVRFRASFLLVIMSRSDGTSCETSVVAGLLPVPGQGNAYMSATCRPGPSTVCLKKKLLR